MQVGVDGYVETLAGGERKRDSAAGNTQQVHRGMAAMVAVDAGRTIVLMSVDLRRQVCMIGRAIAHIHVRCPAEIGKQGEDDQQTSDEATDHGHAYCRKRMGTASHTHRRRAYAHY